MKLLKSGHRSEAAAALVSELKHIKTVIEVSLVTAEVAKNYRLVALLERQASPRVVEPGETALVIAL